MDATKILEGLSEVQDHAEELAETERYVEMGRAFVSLEGRLYALEKIDAMVQRDEVTVVCPILVARPL